MVDRHTTFSGQTSIGTSVVVAEIPLGHLMQLAGWDGFDGALSATLANTTLVPPHDMQGSMRQNQTTLWRIAPDRVLIGSEQPLDLRDLTTLIDIVGLDLSHARVKLRIDGDGATDLLARLVPVDVSLKAFPVDTFVQTSMHHVGVLIDRVSETQFDILVPRNWSRAILDIMRVHLAP